MLVEGDVVPIIHEGIDGNGAPLKQSGWTVARKCLRTITVEPALVLFFFGYGLENVLITNLWIDKICLFYFNYSEAVCKNIDSGQYTEEQLNVQRMTSQFNVYTYILQYLPAVVVVLLLGTWSDVKGRRLPIVIPFLGYFVTSLCITAVSYWWTLPPLYLLLSYLPLALTGGLMGVYAGVYPYLTAVTSGRARTTRMSITGVVIIASATIGIGLAMIIFKRLGYVAVFGIQALLTACAILYVFLALEERPEGDEGRDGVPTEGVLHVLSPSYLKETILVAFRKREGGKRGDILGHISIMMTIVFVAGSYNYNFLYARKKFKWDNWTFSEYKIVDTPVTAIGMLVVLPILSYRFKVEDSIIGLMGGISLLFSNVIKGTAPEPWVMYLASVVGMCLDQVTASSRGAVSKLVSKSEVGAVFAVLGAAEAMMPIAAAAIYNAIYKVTLDFFPGVVFILAAGLGLIICCIYVWIMTRPRPTGGTLECLRNGALHNAA